ncbi:MAG TPA: O-antigen ligase family protein [Flavobacterium sp.]|uniref:O-antigen ligase family protein n=1 Tax=unclassified Flavobacterium TaxID=196869 RepID=UPI0025BB101D|nr:MULTISPECIES: O-antigen ligase family protein [unclassified Flavobacterium]HRE77834.1 O-antigen ligase family protein [Flavobacterium sp.]
MENTSVFLSNVWHDLKQENKEHFSFIPFLLLLCTISMPLGINNVFLGIFLFSVLFKFKTFKFQYSLLVVSALFLLMAISYFWSIDAKATLKAIPKEIGLLLIPMCFMIMKPFTKEQRQKIIKYYSYAIVLYVVFYLIKAIVRFLMTGDTNVFFYHELVTKEVNAIHVSVYVSIAFFYFFIKEIKSKLETSFALLLFVFVFLLSSKNIIIVFILLVLIEFFFFSKSGHKMRLRNLIVLGLIVSSFLFIGKIKDRFKAEFQSNTEKSISHTVLDIDKSLEGINVLSIKEAWTNEKFSPNDFFPGTAFRVYQARMFLELFQEESVFWKGYGLNASYKKLEEKAIQYDVFRGNESQEGYQTKNFHNQYIQNFAELGVFGFLILIILIALNLKNATKNKDFVQIAFAILMISLFLTESFLWRQRGVMFFTLFFCLFNSKEYLPLKKM